MSSFGKPLFVDTDITLPMILQSVGYTTACIGKWHLGWDWNIKNEPSGERTYWGRTHRVYLTEDIDWSGPVKGGPLDRGFDYYFGDGTINFPPYAWIENDRFVEIPNDFFEFNQFERDVKEFDWDSRPGPMVKGWDPYQVLPTLTQKTIEWIGNQNLEKPFFLYLALPSPHTPVIPNDEFDGSSKAGAYGDFVYQTDWVAGEVLKALKNYGFSENTLVIFSSDNGPESIAWERAEKYDHFSMGELRGLKRDVWEGGHRVPFIVKWPGKIKPGTISDEVILQTDIMATLAEIVNVELPEHAAPDSYNFLPVFMGEKYESPLREASVYNTNPEVWGIRKGDWLYINNHTGSGSRKAPDSFMQLRGYKDFDTPGLLFNMKDDKEQRVNLYDKYPEITGQLDNLLQLYRETDSSVNRN